MKKAVFGMAVVFGLGLTGVTDAQAQLIVVGAQGGYNYSQLSDVPSGIDEVGDKGGLVIGAFLDLNFHKLLYVSVEANYVENEAEATDVDGVTTLTQRYFQIPALLGVRLLSGMVQPVLYAGGSASFETTCELRPEGLEAVDCSDPLADLDTKSATFSAIFGGGVNIAVGPVILTGDVRYNLGLTEIAEAEDTKWNGIMGLIGIGFGIG